MNETEYIDLIGLWLLTIGLLEDKFDYLSKKWYCKTSASPKIKKNRYLPGYKDRRFGLLRSAYFKS